MHSLETMVEIKVLARRGKSIKGIARELGVSRNTVRKYLRDAARPKYGPRLPRSLKLDPFMTYLQDRVVAAKPDWIPATVVIREIREQGYAGGISQLKVFLARLKPPRVAEPVVRFETPPGKQMQVDFISIRRGRDRLSAFVATLGYSRATFVQFVTDEKIETVLACLRRSFEAFGGVPEHVLFDNMKTVVLGRDAYGDGLHRFHPQLLELAKDCGFSIRLCRPYRAKTKGKVERFNRYLRYSFWIPLKARFNASGLLVDRDTANLEVSRWLREVANRRVHGELNERPCDRLQIERECLQPYAGTVVNHVDFNSLARAVPIPIESLQHPLSSYDALVVQR
ncbi:MAG: IS21 family transposase [Proteobacteria bacterium]|nr:IS21 family transposase [Pseudomonadota bacterium]